MENVIACRPECFGRYRDRAFESLERLGILNVELHTAPRPELESVVESLRQHGLQVSSGAFYDRAQEPDFLERVRNVVEVTASLGARVLFTSQHAGNEREQVYERLRQAGEIAAEKDVTIVLETHPDLGLNARAALATMEGINHPNVRINFDPANIYYYNEGVDAINELEQIVPYVRAVHLKDSNGGYQTHNFPAIGDGVVDWKSLFRVLNDAGMYGPFTLEMEGIAGEDLTYEQTYDRFQRSLDHLSAIGAVS